jgi:hypothetical protein
MSDTKNRASSKRRTARVIKVAPVTLAIRAALAVSATTFAFAAGAANPVANPPAAVAGQHQAIHHFAVVQPVVDLTTVVAAQQPSSVFDAPVAVHHSAGITASGDVAPGAESFGSVQDLIAVPTLTPGPGGVSGSDNQVSLDRSGVTTFNSSAGSPAVPTSTTGYSDLLFAASDHFDGFTNNGSIGAVGATWAAGFELEAVTYARDVRNSSTGTITTTATGDYGHAWGIYTVAGEDADLHNDGTINVYADGYAGTATGLFGYSQTSTASTENTGTINAYANGDYGQAWGTYAAANGDASATNSATGYVNVQSYGAYAAATGIAAYSIAGDASASNAGGIFAGAFGDAAGMAGVAAQGDVALGNSGGIQVYSGAGNALGMLGYAAAGDVSVTNTGAINAYSYGAVADGIFASGTSVDVTNSGDIYAAGALAGFGIEAQGSDLTTVTNDGAIVAYSFAAGSQAVGVYATGGAGGVTIDNSGPITALGYYTAGIEAYSQGEVSIANTGAITVGSFNYTAYAAGIRATNNYENSDIVVDNMGDISAYAYFGATGIEVAATGIGSSAAVTNSAVIYAGQVSSNGGDATGIFVSADHDASIDNSGSVTTVSSLVSSGLVAAAVSGDASVTNSGDVDASSSAMQYYGAYGIVATSVGGAANVDNSGNVTVLAGDNKYGIGWVGAGIQANGSTGATVTNSGSLTVGAKYAYGVTASAGQGDVAISNADGASIQVESYGPYGFAAGAFGISTVGDVSIDNAGTVYASATGSAFGLFGVADEGNVDVANDGGITTYSSSGGATGMFGNAAGGDATLSNSGDIAAIAYDGTATGMRGLAANGNVSLNNTGGIDTSSEYGSAIGMLGYAAGGDVDVTNGGAITAAAYDNAIGMYGYSLDGGVTLDNSGTITVTSAQGTADGMFASGLTVDVTNSGSIDATGYYSAAGIEAQGGDLATVNNDGTITATSLGGAAYGVYATAGASGATVGNTGSIAVVGYYATGIEVRSEGAISITNTGDITVGDAAYSAYATGIHAINNYENSDITVTNGGDIVVSAYYGATGIDVSATGQGSSASVANTGAIDVNHASKYGDSAIGIAVAGDANASIDNAGSVTTVSGLSSYGTMAIAFNGDASVVNSGDIDATSTAMKYYAAVGMLSASPAGAAFADNSGNVHVTSNRYIGTGIQVSGNTGATATNSGAISVNAKYAYGIVGTATQGDVALNNMEAGTVELVSDMGAAIGLVGISTVGDVGIDNAGSVSVAAYGLAYGVLAIAHDGNANVTNGGSLYAYSYGDVAAGVYAIATNGDVSVQNSGTIAVVAHYDTAIGIYGIGANSTSFLDNSGSITATGGLYGAAIGVLGAGYASSVSNSGSIAAVGYDNATGVVVDVYAGGAVANATAGHISATANGDAYGVFATSYAGVASVDNAGLIEAATTYAGGLAAGVYAAGYAGTQVTNSGTIDAHSAAGSDAIGVIARGNGAVVVDNSGTISATDDDHAVGVSMDSATGTATLVNTGIVRTDSTLEGEVAVQGADGVQQVLNYGDIYGAVITAGGDDVFSNGAAGTWHVTNHSTDFGDGDDSIGNAAGGTIELAFHGAIHLGASGPAGNAFVNDGTIRVLGRGLIDMGTSGSAANLLPLENNGIIDFVDGATNDMLTIAGDLGGTGGVSIDINPVTATADQLAVNGNVTGTQAVFINVAGAPLSAHIDPIVFANVSGDSTGGSFVGGGVVGYDASSFLDLQVNVSSQIDASNATRDVFAVGLDVAGLNDAGSLAATMTSSAQSIVNAQVGTWRQRMGVLPQKRDTMVGLSPWIRFFSDSGTVNVSHAADNFGNSGTFSFDQTTTGRELGMNVDFDNGLNTGLLLAKADGSQRLRGAGVGTDHIDSSTVGVYGTWISTRGFYVDASYRWLEFDAHLKSAGGPQSSDGNGEAINVEAGYTAWTFSGVDIAPQVQYTRTTVDGFRAIHGSSVDFQAGDVTSSRGRLGVAFSKTLDAAGWVWTPYGSVNAVREFDGESGYNVGDVFSGSTATDGTSAMVELGLGAQKDGVSVTAGANWTDGGAMQSFVGGQVVLRYTW